MQNKDFSQSQNEIFKLKELVKSLSLQVQEKDQVINNKDQFIEQLKEALQC